MVVLIATAAAKCIGTNIKAIQMPMSYTAFALVFVKAEINSE